MENGRDAKRRSTGGGDQEEGIRKRLRRNNNTNVTPEDDAGAKDGGVGGDGASEAATATIAWFDRNARRVDAAVNAVTAADKRTRLLMSEMLTDTECPICQEMCLDMLVLPCQHCICRRCMTSIITKRKVQVRSDMQINRIEAVGLMFNSIRCDKTMIACPMCKDAQFQWITDDDDDDDDKEYATTTLDSIPSNSIRRLASLIQRCDSTRLTQMLENSGARLVAASSCSGNGGDDDDDDDVSIHYDCNNAPACTHTSESSEDMAQHWQRCRRYTFECPFRRRGRRRRKKGGGGRTDDETKPCPAGNFQIEGCEFRDRSLKTQYLTALRNHLRTGLCRHRVVVDCAACKQRVPMKKFKAHSDSHLDEMMAVFLCGEHHRVQELLRGLKSCQSASLCQCSSGCNQQRNAACQDPQIVRAAYRLYEQSATDEGVDNIQFDEGDDEDSSDDDDEDDESSSSDDDNTEDSSSGNDEEEDTDDEDDKDADEEAESEED